ncbi:MAG: DUF6290 family protein [archaeon]|nr:DUF6290 family protein [archaeon]
MEVKIVLDEEEEVLVKYYAEVMEMSVEDAFKDALLDKIRELYEAQAASQPRAKCTYQDDPIEKEDDMFSDEDR